MLLAGIRIGCVILDLKRMNRVLDFVNSYPGIDQLRIRLVGPAKTHVLDFPNHSTNYEGEVADFLRAEFGDGRGLWMVAGHGERGGGRADELEGELAGGGGGERAERGAVGRQDEP